MLLPADSLELVAGADAARGDALAIAEGERLTELLRSPGRDVSAKSGAMERDAPLFFGTGENPGLF